MDGAAAINELNELTDRAKNAVVRLRKTGIAYAEADAVYREALAIEMLNLREAGHPVTIIEKLAVGTNHVKKRKKDIAEVEYRATQEELYNLRLQIRVLENQIKMEWGLPGD